MGTVCVCVLMIYMHAVENIDSIWMRYAIMFADYANLFGEVPVGAVLIDNGKIVGYGWNSSIIHDDPTAHAEILALRMGGRCFNNYRLLGTTLYVTLEPCIMCIGAILHARIYRLVYGAADTKSNQSNTISLQNMLRHFMNKHHVLVTTGVLENECSMQLNKFFLQKRKKFFNKKYV